MSDQITLEFKIPESFFFIFECSFDSYNKPKLFHSIIQCTDESCRFYLMSLNKIKSEDEYESITKLLLPDKPHFDYLLKPTKRNYENNIYYSAYHLINKF